MDSKDDKCDNILIEKIYSKIKKSEFQAIYDDEILENIINHLYEIGYININYLAEGASGIVLSAKSLNLIRKVAVKVVRITPELEKNMQNLNDEISILKKYIYHEIYQIKKKQFMIQITELCDNSLEDELEFLRKHEKSLSDKMKFQIIIQILEAVNFIHSNQIVHRDLKASNIFMKDGVPKIGDFGISTNSDKTLSSLKGTPIFMAPEIFDKNYKFPVDIYSLGLILLMIENPKFNYESKNTKLSIHCIQFQQGIIPSELNFDINSILYKCAAQMIKTDPLERKDVKYYIEYILQYCQQKNIEMCNVISLLTQFEQQNKERINKEFIKSYYGQALQNNFSIGTLKRFRKELLDYQKDPLENVTIFEVNESSIYYWKVLLQGPKESMYQNLNYELIVIFPSIYPFKIPKIRFITPIYHPVVYQNGVFCCEADCLGERNWVPSKKVKSILQELNVLLKSLQGYTCGKEKQQQFRNNPLQYLQKVVEYQSFNNYEILSKEFKFKLDKCYI